MRWLLLLCLIGCASAPRAEGDPNQPFIKLSNRKMALLVFWRGEPEAGFAEGIERQLERRLSSAYHTQPLVQRIDGAYLSLSATQVKRFADKAIDDVVVFELRRDDDGQRVTGRLVVFPLTTGQPVLKKDIPPIAGRGAEAVTAKRVANFAARKLTYHWTDPAAAPALDLLLVAIRLAESKACDEALALFTVVYPKGSGPITELEKDSIGRRRQAECEAQIALRDALEKDRTAQFGIELDVSGVAPHYKKALERAVSKARTFDALRSQTDKPVIIRVRPGAMILDVRYQEKRYRQQQAQRPKYQREHLVLYLDGFLPLMRALVRTKRILEKEVPPYERRTVEGFGTVLHLRKVMNDYAEIDFAPRGSDILIADTLRVKLGRREPTEVRSANTRVTRTKRMLLGPPRTPEGSLTTYGLVSQFFGLEP